MLAKKIVHNLFVSFKNIIPKYDKNICEDYYSSSLSTGILVNNNIIGSINVLKESIIKKKSIVLIKIDFDEYKQLEKQVLIYNPISKYPSISLDYTIITNKTTNYDFIEKIIEEFDNSFINSLELINVYENEAEKRYTVRYSLVSYDRTLTANDIEEFKNSFIVFIKRNKLSIVE